MAVLYKTLLIVLFHFNITLTSRNTMLTKKHVLITFNGTDKQQTVPIYVLNKMDMLLILWTQLLINIVINFPQHCLVRRIQPLFILLYACCSVSINAITSVSWVWKTQNKQNQKQKVAANHYRYTSLLMFLFTGFPQNILFRVNVGPSGSARA